MSIALSETFHIGMAVEDIDQCCTDRRGSKSRLAPN